MTNNAQEKLQEEINKELGYISALFMSQGDTRAGDIVMPSTELQEALDRIMLYVFGYQKQALAEREEEIEKLIEQQDIFCSCQNDDGCNECGGASRKNYRHEFISDIKALLTKDPKGK